MCFNAEYGILLPCIDSDMAQMISPYSLLTVRFEISSFAWQSARRSISGLEQFGPHECG